MLSYRDKLSQSFLTDELVGLLRSEGVISKDTQEMIIDYDNILDYEPFRAVCVTVADDHQKLKVLADVLLKSTETAPLGRELADKYCESTIIIILSVINLLIKLVLAIAVANTKAFINVIINVSNVLFFHIKMKNVTQFSFKHYFRSNIS